MPSLEEIVYEMLKRCPGDDAIGRVAAISSLTTTTIRVGWASGNALMMLLVGGSAANRNFSARSYESSASEAAKLDIDYTAGGGGGATIRRYSLSLTGVG